MVLFLTIIIRYFSSKSTICCDRANILNNIEGYQFEKGKLNSDNYINYLSKKLPLEISELKETDELGKSYGEKIKDIILSYLNRGGSRPDGVLSR